MSVILLCRYGNPCVQIFACKQRLLNMYLFDKIIDLLTNLLASIYNCTIAFLDFIYMSISFSHLCLFFSPITQLSMHTVQCEILRSALSSPPLLTKSLSLSNTHRPRQPHSSCCSGPFITAPRAPTVLLDTGMGLANISWNLGLWLAF